MFSLVEKLSLNYMAASIHFQKCPAVLFLYVFEKEPRVF